MRSSTSSSPPSARGKVWRSAWMSRSALLIGAPLTNSELAFGVAIERTPKHAIDDDDEQAHHRDAEHDAVKIAGFGLLRNIGAEPVGSQVLVAPGRDLGDDAGVPRTAGSCDCARHVIRQHR